MIRERTWEFCVPNVGLPCPGCGRPLPAPARTAVVAAPSWFAALPLAARALDVNPDELMLVGHT